MPRNDEKDLAAQPRNDDDDNVPEVDPDAVEDLLARELQSLSFQRRNEDLEVVHGVKNLAPEETPEMIQQSLQVLSQELHRIPDQDKQAYIEAQKLKTTHVNDEDFRLRFLRCELFDARKAAIRMVKFLDMLMEYYGKLALERPIKLSDLGKDATEVLRAGQTLQMLPFRDRSGRRVFTVVTDFGLKNNYDSRVSEVLLTINAYMVKFWLVAFIPIDSNNRLLGPALLFFFVSYRDAPL
jgi:hypothetical protein